MKRARSLIDRGSLGEAKPLLNAQLQKHPDDVESRLLLGEIALRENEIDKAKALFEPLLTTDDNIWRVSQVYREAAHRAEFAGANAVVAFAAAEAVRLNRLAAPDMCKTLLRRARHDQNGKWLPVVSAAGGLDSDCRSQTIALLRNWLDTADPQTLSPDNIIAIGIEAKDLDSSTSADTARAVRAVAERVAKVDRVQATSILSRIFTIDRAVADDFETSMLRNRIGPITVEETATDDEVSTGQYSGTPAEVTTRILKELGECATMYRGQHGHYPVTNDFGDAWVMISPYAQSEIRLEDAWGSRFRYMSDGAIARLESAGPDRTMAATGDNIVWENGHIVQSVRY